MRGLDFEGRDDSEPLADEEKALAVRAADHLRKVVTEFADTIQAATTVGELRKSEAIIDRLDDFE